MEVLITHLTRMKANRLCVAGIAMDDGREVRPVTDSDDVWTTADLRENGGALAVGAIVDFGDAQPRPTRPESEDCLVSRAAAAYSGEAVWSALLEVLRERAQSVSAIFGDDLEPDGATYSMAEGRGERSLGVVHLPSDGRLKNWGTNVRFECAAGTRQLAIQVVDVRLWDYGSNTVDANRVDQVQTAIRTGDSVATVGLTRPWAKPQGHGRRRHWFQINNIFTPKPF